MNMEMTNFPGAGWHELFDDAEVGCPNEVPTVAVVSMDTSPLIMRSGLPTDDRCHWVHPAFRLTQLKLLGDVPHSEDMEVLESTLENVDK